MSDDFDGSVYDDADTSIDEYLEQLPTMSSNAIDEAYCKLLGAGDQQVLLLKFKTRVQSISQSAGECACLAIVRNGERLPDLPGDFSQFHILALIVIRDFLRTLTPIQRVPFALRLLREAQPLSFAGMCLAEIQLHGNQHESERLFTINEEAELRKSLTERIAIYAATNCLVTGRPAQFGPLLHFWLQVCGGVPIAAHLKRVLAETPEIAKSLLFLVANVSPPSVRIDEARFEVLKQYVKLEDLIAAINTLGLQDPLSSDDAAKLARDVVALHRASKSQL